MRKQEEMGINCNNGLSDSDNCGIDKLPDDILIKILSHASLNESARASVLARKWRYMWRFAHKTLRFHHADTATGNILEMEKFEPWVTNVSELHQERYVEGIVISFEVKRGKSRMTPISCLAVESWVRFATQKEVQRFELNLSLLVRCIFPSLERLISHSKGVTSPLCHVRTLRLVHVDITDEVVHFFLASCPDLEVLCIRFSYATENLLVKDPPRLRVLEISRCSRIKSLEISAVSLVSLTYGGTKNSLVLKKIPKLRELTISGYFFKSFLIEPKKHWSYSALLEKFVLDFRFLNSASLLVPRSDLPHLSSLKRMEVQVYTTDSALSSLSSMSLFLTSLIEASPKLREYRIEMSYSKHSYLNNARMPFHGKKAGMKDMEFVHRNLKVVEFGGYVGCLGEEELVLALIEIGPSIERVVIDTETRYYDNPYIDEHIDIGATERNEARERANKLVFEFPGRIKSTVM